MRVKDKAIKNEIDHRHKKEKGHKQRGKNKLGRRMAVANYRRQLRGYRISRMRGKAREWSPYFDAPKYN